MIIHRNRWRFIRLAAATLALSSTSACSFSAASVPDDRALQAEALRTVFPIVEQLGVRTFRDQDWCRVIVYPRGAFTSDTTPTCTITDEVWRPFDGPADVAFGELAAAVRGTGIDVRLIDGIELENDGTLGAITFTLLSVGDELGYKRLIFDRGGAMPPDDSETTNTRIDEHWYFQFEDWM